jgi:hypothetical protein
MMHDDHPTRVIYAKLTSTGAYDVVARTRDIPLDQARTLAEQLLPGNPPLDADAVELVGYLRPASGDHVVMHFSRYPWKDGDRGDVYSTDIVQLSDAAFRAVRNNAFAAVPHSDRVFDVLTELPDTGLPAASTATEHARLRALLPVRDDARAAIANALAADRVLLVHGANRAEVMELFTLLLPPALRPQLTFLTQTFRVPVVLPRVTLVDRHSANLRDGAWTALPSADVDVPMELAGRLLALADDTGVLALAHEMFDDAHTDASAAVPLRAGIVRLTRLADLARALRRDDVISALQLLAQADMDARERAAGLRRLRDSADADALRSELVKLLRQGGDSAAQAHRIVTAASFDGATVRALIDALPASAPQELALALTAQAAAAGNVPHVLDLLARDRRAVATHLEPGDSRMPDDLVRLLAAMRRAVPPHYDIAAAAQVLTEAASLRASLDDHAADRLHALCRDTVADVVQHAPAHVRTIAPLRQLIDAAALYRRAGAHASLLPESADQATRFAADGTESAAAALGVAFLDRALDAHGGARTDSAVVAQDVEIACALLAAAGPAGRELVRHMLAQRNVAEHDLVALPGAEALLPLVGGTAAQAMLTRRLVAAIGAAAAGGAGIAELADAVFAAHSQHVRITPGTELSQRVSAALRSFADAHERSTPAAELCLELLAVITPPAHMAELEDAALGSHMTVRLRRLDRSIAVCRAAEDERRYDRIAEALESGRGDFDGDARERLRRALGTGGLSRRLMRLVASVVEKEAP